MFFFFGGGGGGLTTYLRHGHNFVLSKFTIKQLEIVKNLSYLASDRYQRETQAKCVSQLKVAAKASNDQRANVKPPVNSMHSVKRKNASVSKVIFALRFKADDHELKARLDNLH